MAVNMPLVMLLRLICISVFCMTSILIGLL